MSKKKPSRAERFAEAKDKVEEGKGSMEELREELQSWFDNLPENLQSGSKAEELQTAIDQLDEVINLCDEIVGMDVDFPGAFGR